MAKTTKLLSVKEVLDGLDAAVSETAAAAKKSTKKGPAKKAAAKAPAKKTSSKTVKSKTPVKKTVAKKTIADMTLAELKAEAKSRGLTGYSSKSKADLLKMLADKSGTTHKIIKTAKPAKRITKKAGGAIVTEDDTTLEGMKVNTLGPSVAVGDGPAVPRDSSPEVEIEFLLGHIDAPEAVSAMQAKFKTGPKLPDLKPMEMLSQWIVRAIAARDGAVGAMLLAARAVSREKAAPTDVHNRLRGFKRADLVRLAKKHAIKVAPSAKTEVVLKALLDAVAKGNVEFRRAVLEDIIAGAGELKPVPVTPGAKAKLKEPRVSYTSKPAKKGYNWSVKNGHGKVLAGPFKTEKSAAAMAKLKTNAPEVFEPADTVGKGAPAANNALVQECVKVRAELDKAARLLMQTWNDTKDNEADRAVVTQLHDRADEVSSWMSRLSSGGSGSGVHDDSTIKSGLEEFSSMAQAIINKLQHADKTAAKGSTPKGAKYPTDAKGLLAYIKVQGEAIREKTNEMEKGTMFANDATQVVAEAKALMNHVRAAAKGSTEITDYIVRTTEALHEGAEQAFQTGKFKPDSKGKPEKDGHGRPIWYPEDKPYLITAHWRPVSNKTVTYTYETLEDAEAKVKEWLSASGVRKPQGMSIYKAVRKPGPKKAWPYGWSKLPVKRIARDGTETIPKGAVV